MTTEGQTLQVSNESEKSFVQRTYDEFAALTNSCDKFENLISNIIAKTQNRDRRFFHVMGAYYTGYMAAMLQCSVKSATRGRIPLGNYCIAMAPSGFGKGYSQHILEKQVFNKFSWEITHKLFDESFELNVSADAAKIARIRNVDPDTIEQRIRAEYESAGPFLPIFDSATKAAIRQQRGKIQAAHLGSLNLVQDEFGSNMSGSVEELAMMLELYDTGHIKNKLVSNTKERKRDMPRDTPTPATLMLFGTQSKVFDGSRTEEDFISLLQTGFARRCLFAWGTEQTKSESKGVQNIERRYDLLLNASDESIWENISDELEARASQDWMHKIIHLRKHEELILLNYQIECEAKAKTLNEFAELEKIELVHRHSKALKLAGSLAVFEGEGEISENTLLSAIRIVEESGKSFISTINRERNYAILARFLVAKEEPQTLADLSEKLPFFKTGYAARREMLDLAASWGRKKFITINKTVEDGIEMYQGTAHDETDLKHIRVSVSQTVANGFGAVEVSWDRIGKLLKLSSKDMGYPGEETAMNWCTHQFENGNRKKENTIPGFNLLVLDIDGTASLDSVHEVFRDYHFATCTTKSHTPEVNRFRVIIPLNIHMQFDADQYQQFVKNILDYLPFKSDKAAASIAHKWLTNPKGDVYVNDNEDAVLFDVFPFIPGTRRNELRKEQLRELQKEITNHSRLISWFVDKMNKDGERNNHMFRLGMVLIEADLGLKETVRQLELVNRMIENPLDNKELLDIGNSLRPRYVTFMENKKKIQDAEKLSQQEESVGQDEWDELNEPVPMDSDE